MFRKLFKKRKTVRHFDPVTIDLLYQSASQIMASDLCGVQPMREPTGLIFAMKAEYQKLSLLKRLKNKFWCKYYRLLRKLGFKKNPYYLKQSWKIKKFARKVKEEWLRNTITEIISRDRMEKDYGDQQWWKELRVHLLANDVICAYDDIQCLSGTSGIVVIRDLKLKYQKVFMMS